MIFTNFSPYLNVKSVFYFLKARFNAPVTLNQQIIVNSPVFFSDLTVGPLTDFDRFKCQHNKRVFFPCGDYTNSIFPLYLPTHYRRDIKAFKNRMCRSCN